jgi:uncharacterized protein
MTLGGTQFSSVGGLHLDRIYVQHNYDIMTTVNGLKFEWDATKAASNQRQHGVSFEEAETAFADERGRLIADPDHSDEEDRFILMGMSVHLRLLVVCHCYRHGDTIRIISARRANRSERKQYEVYKDA